MTATLLKFLKRALAVLAALLVVILAWRIYDSLRAPHLERWHTFAPSEASAAQIAKLDWAGYLAVEQKLFDPYFSRPRRSVRAHRRNCRRRARQCEFGVDR